MGTQVDQEKLKAMAAELAKDIKSEKDLGALTQQLVKLTVETALNAELDEHLGYEKHAPQVAVPATVEMATLPSASRASMVKCQSSHPVTGTALSSRSSSARDSPD